MKFRFSERINGKPERIEAECVSWGEIAEDVASARWQSLTAKFDQTENKTLKELMVLVWLRRLSDVDLYYFQHGKLQSITREVLYRVLRSQDWMPEEVRKAPEGTPEPGSHLWKLIADIERLKAKYASVSDEDMLRMIMQEPVQGLVKF